MVPPQARVSSSGWGEKIRISVADSACAKLALKIKKNIKKLKKYIFC